MSEPTTEQLRNARHRGAATALAHLPEERRNALLETHKKLDARREKNVGDFLSKARGGKAV